MSRFRTEINLAYEPRPVGKMAADGISDRALSGREWQRASRGLYLPAPAEPTPAQRILNAAALLPECAAIGGWAAAYALGADYLDGHDGQRPAPVLVFVPAPLHRGNLPGAHYARDALDPRDVVRIEGIRFTGPARTALDLACRAPSLTEAVVRLDQLATVVWQPELRGQWERRKGRRGIRRARQAAALMREGVRSPGESRLRMEYLLLTGVSALVNPLIYDADGRPIGMPDLLDPEAGLVMEYDGAAWSDSERMAGHRDKDQHREDNVREERFERAGLIVLRADAADVGRHRAALTRRMAAARADGLSRDRRHDRWTLAER